MVSSASQIVKPSAVSKPACSNNVTKRNVCNVSSISRFVKKFSVTKSICSSNAYNSVICNSTWKPFFNFFSDCQSLKTVRARIDVKGKHAHKRIAINKSSCQRRFTKPFSAVNSLMMPICSYELILLFFIFHHNFFNNNVDHFFKS